MVATPYLQLRNYWGWGRCSKGAETNRQCQDYSRWIGRRGGSRCGAPGRCASRACTPPRERCRRLERSRVCSLLAARRARQASAGRRAASASSAQAPLEQPPRRELERLRPIHRKNLLPCPTDIHLLHYTVYSYSYKYSMSMNESIISIRK